MTSSLHAIMIHGLDEARQAVARDPLVDLRSAPGAALYAGIGWWQALIAALRAETGWQGKDFLDCADQPAFAVEALHAGVCRLMLDGECPQFADLAALAHAAGGELLASL